MRTMGKSNNINILVVEDSKSLLKIIKRNLEKNTNRFNVTTANSGHKALSMIDRKRFDVIVSDLIMPGVDGLDLLKELRWTRNLKIPFIIFSGNSNKKNLIKALNLGGDHYVLKEGDPNAQYHKLACAIIQKYNHFHKNNSKQIRPKEKSINIIRELSIPTFIIDSDHNIIEWNKALENLTKIGREDVIGTSNAWKAFYPEKRPTLADLLLDGRIDEIEKYSKRFFKAKHCLRGYTAEKWITLNDERLYLRFTATTVMNSGGEIIKVIETIEDRTDQKRIKEKKELFNSIFRHDANNMINVCYGFLNLLKDTELTNEQEQYVGEALNSAKGVISIIEKVSKLQKIGEEETKDLSLEELIRDVVDKSRFQAKKKEISIELSVPNFQSKVEAGSLLEDVFINLIGNSIQHSGCDTIKISGWESNDEIICSIEDNGRGIKQEHKEKLFTRGFKQGKNAGSGLGLFLVKKITENYGGHIEVSDSGSGGLKFKVYLKKSQNELQEGRDSLSQIEGKLQLDEQLKSTQNASQELIMVVDDNKQFLYYMEILLKNNGFEAITFKSAEEALSFLKNRDYSSVPDLIISDIRMPDISGYDFFKKLSLNPKLNRIPFIFLSGLASKEDIRLGKILGADDYITKPVHEEDIIASVKGKIRRKKTEHLFKKEIDKFVTLKDTRQKKNIEKDEEIVLFLTFWDDKKGPKLIKQYPQENTNGISISNLGTQIFQAIVPLYGQSKNISQSQDLLFKINNVDKHAYLYFDAFQDESKRSMQTEFMLAVIAPTISYFESLKLKKVLSKLSSLIKEERGAEIINFETFWKKIIDTLRNTEL